MIDGRSGGTGKYSYRAVHYGNREVKISHMPEDGYKFRIAFLTNGETQLPIWKLDYIEAEMLWAALKLMAEDMNWNDKMLGEILGEKPNRERST